MTLLILAWIVASLGGGAALARLTKRIHESISFKKNWLYFAALLALSTAVLYAVALR